LSLSQKEITSDMHYNNLQLDVCRFFLLMFAREVLHGPIPSHQLQWPKVPQYYPSSIHISGTRPP
jgi:hypothetical protein